MNLRRLFSFFINIILISIVAFCFFKVKELHIETENKKAISTSEIIKNIDIRKKGFYRDSKYYSKFLSDHSLFGKKNQAAFMPDTQLYYLQIATFLNVENAMTFQKKFNNFDLRIVEVNRKSKKFYIIISNYFESKEKALKLAKSFKRYSPILRER